MLMTTMIMNMTQTADDDGKMLTMAWTMTTTMPAWPDNDVLQCGCGPIMRFCNGGLARLWSSATRAWPDDTFYLDRETHDDDNDDYNDYDTDYDDNDDGDDEDDDNADDLDILHRSAVDGIC